METETAIATLSALAQATRLDVFRALVAAEPLGVTAGDLARRLDVPANTLSTHLAILTRAGLIQGERKSRTITYRAELNHVRGLLAFLMKDCCGGKPDICAPLIDELTCSPDKVSCA